MEEKRPDQPRLKLIYQRYYQLKLRKKFGKIDLNSRDIWNNTPLHNALKYGNEELAGWLIKSGACVNNVDTGGNTPLHLAARFGTTSIYTVRLLLKHMSDVNSKNNSGFTPLHEAVYAENVKMAKWSIINRGSKSDYTISIPRVLYSFYDNTGSKFLKHSRWDPPTCLMKDTTTMVRILVEAGADVNQQTVEGWTALHFAVERSLVDVIDILLQNGASVILTAQNLPECLLLEMPRKVLQKYGIIYKVVNDTYTYINVHSGTTVLHQAAELNITCIARVILDRGADINAQDSRGKTALHIAVDNFQYHMVEFLILNGANINIKDNYGHVPLANIFFDRFFKLDFQRNMVKYIVLWQYDQEHLFMKSSRTGSPIQLLWDNCEDAVNKMKDFVFEGSNISLYTILRHIFNQHRLANYLKRRSIIQSLSDWISNDIYCTIFPEYEKVIETIPHNLKAAEERNLIIDELILVFNGILPQLPPEIVVKICSYLNTYDLKNFMLSVCKIS